MVKLNELVPVRASGVPSWSRILAGVRVTVQVSLLTKSESGLRVKMLGPPETAAVWAPLVPQEMLYQGAVTVTASEKVRERLASRATPVALLAGVVELRVGAESSSASEFVGEELFRRTGVRSRKIHSVVISRI